jgi:hypothetical protein
LQLALQKIAEKQQAEQQRQQNVCISRARVSDVQEKNAKKVLTASEKLLRRAINKQ